MNQAFYREMLLTRPELLKAIIAFNRPQQPLPALGLDVSLSRALQNHPEVADLLRAGEQGSFDGNCYWDFSSASTRLALLPGTVLRQLALMTAAAAYAETIASTLRRDEVRALRDVLGEPIHRWVLTRGRFLIGTLAQSLQATVSEDNPARAVAKLARGVLEALRSDWPEELRARTEMLFSQLELPAADGAILSEDLRRRVWYFFKKLIERELDQQWKHYFD